MRDDLVLQNTTSKIVTLTLRSATTGQFVADATYDQFSGNWAISGGTTSALSFASGSEGDAYSSGKVCPRGDGSYDWHVPDSMLTTLGQVTATISVTNAIDVRVEFQIVGVDRGSAAFGAPTASQINNEVDTALADYDGPTKGELDAAQSSIESVVQAVNTGAARHIAILTAGSYEVPDAGTTQFGIEIRTYDGDGNPAAIDASADPTVTISQIDGTDLSSDLSAIANPATGVYRLTYSVDSGDSVQPLRIEASGTINATLRSTSAYPVVTDAVAVDFTTADRNVLNALTATLGTPAGVDMSADVAGVLASVGENATKLDTLQVTSTKIETTLEDDGESGWQWTTLAMANAPAGGGGGGGSSLDGARTVTITVTDEDDTPIVGAIVRVTLGVDEEAKKTLDGGVVTFNLDDGDWTIAITKSMQYSFAGATLTVAANTTKTYEMATLAAPTPTEPSLCVVQSRLLIGATPVPGATFSAELIDNNTISTAIISQATMSDETDDDGIASLELVHSDLFTGGIGRYRLTMTKDGETHWEKTVTVPSVPSIWADEL